MASITEGTAILFITSSPFTSITGTPTTPTSVTFTYQIAGQTPIANTWTSGSPGSVISNTGTGTFQAGPIDTTGKPGTWVYQWSGTSSARASDVVWEGEVLVSPQVIT